MSTKAKYTLLTLAVMCIVSIALNVFQYKSAQSDTKNNAGTTALTDSATIKKIQSIEAQLDDYDRKFRDLDKNFNTQLEGLRKDIQSSTNTNKEAVGHVIAQKQESMNIVNEIHGLIAQLEQIKSAKSNDNNVLLKEIQAAQKKFDEIKNEQQVKEAQAHCPAFAKCVKQEWMTATDLMCNVNNSNRASHIQAICDALKSLQDQLRPKTDTK